MKPGEINLRKSALVSYLISLALVLAILYAIDLNEVIPAIIAFGWPAFVALALFNVFSFLLRGLRWKLIVSPLASLSFSESTYITWTGFFGNYVLPVRAGELIRALILSVKKKLGKIRAFSTVAVDRVVDGVILIFFFSLGLLLAENIPSSIQQTAVIPFLLFAGALIFFMAPRKLLKKMKPAANLLPFGRQTIIHFLSELSLGSGAFRLGFSKQLLIWLSSFLIWLSQAIILLAVATLMQINLSWGQILLLLAVAGFGMMVPSAPGAIGPYEGAFLLVFAALGLSTNQAISMAVISHLIQFATVIGGGLFSLNRLKLSWKGLFAKAEFKHGLNDC